MCTIKRSSRDLTQQVDGKTAYRIGHPRLRRSIKRNLEFATSPRWGLTVPSNDIWITKMCSEKEAMSGIIPFKFRGTIETTILGAKIIAIYDRERGSTTTLGVDI